jgi:hypothetical protein
LCTCGAQLPENALFCHRCGRPQREDLIEAAPPAREDAEPRPRQQAPQPPASSEIGFGNRSAVNIALICAAITSMLISVQLGVFTGFWVILMLLVSGFGAVYLYERRSGVELSVRSGARMGWMTGFFCFLILMVLFTIQVVSASRQGGLGAYYREQFQAHASGDAALQEAMKILESPAGVAALIALTLIFAFLMFTAIPMAGGALGAKVLEKE